MDSTRVRIAPGTAIALIALAGNGAPNAIASGGGGAQASADRIGAGTFRITTYPAGRADPGDFAFVVVLV